MFVSCLAGCEQSVTAWVCHQFSKAHDRICELATFAEQRLNILFKANLVLVTMFMRNGEETTAAAETEVSFTWPNT